MQQGDCRLRRVEPDAIADAAITVRVVGEHDRNAALGRRLLAQACPVAREIGDKSDAVGNGAVADEIDFRFGVAAERRLERHGARQNAAIDFGQRDIHREIARPEPARAGAPRFFVAA